MNSGFNQNHGIGMQPWDVPEIVKNQNESDLEEREGEHQFEPVLISQLADVIDVKTTLPFSIALYQSDYYRIPNYT